MLSELILGLRERGVQVTVIARTCELPAGSGVRFHRVRGPGRPFLLAYPWFLLAASLVVARRARGVLQVTGGDRAQPRRRGLGPLLPPGRTRQPEPREPPLPGQHPLRAGRQAPVRAGGLQPQPRGGVRVRLGGRRRGGPRALPAPGAAGDRDPQRRRPGPLRAGAPARAGRGAARASWGSASSSCSRCSWAASGSARACGRRSRRSRTPPSGCSLSPAPATAPTSSSWPATLGRARTRPLARGSARGRAPVCDGRRVRAADQLRDVLAGHLRGRRQRPTAAGHARQRDLASCSSRASTVSSSSACRRASRAPWGSSRATARGCSRWAARRAGPRFASAGRTPWSATWSSTGASRGGAAVPSPERAVRRPPAGVARCGIAAPLLADIRGRPDTL